MDFITKKNSMPHELIDTLNELIDKLNKLEQKVNSNVDKRRMLRINNDNTWAGIMTKEQLDQRRKNEEEYWAMSEEERQKLYHFSNHGFTGGEDDKAK